MEIHRSLDNLPSINNAVLTIGAYDGVHHGHRAILERLIDIAREVDGQSILLTFDPHPRKVIFPYDKEFRYITTLDEKTTLLRDTGIDHLIILPFTVEFSQINPYVYVESVLIDKIQAKHIIIGYDHQFGMNRAGNIDLLRQYEEKGHFKVHQIERQDIDELKVSSTKVRNAIIAGDMARANKLLRAPFSLTGHVTSGDGIGTDLGYPTANLSIKEADKIIPQHGIYAAKCEVDGHIYEGMLYIGHSATLKEGAKVAVEINIFHQYDEALNGKEMQIWPLQFIRSDEKFESKEELLFNIAADKVEIERFFYRQSKKARITIAILNYNGRDLLQSYLPSIIRDADGIAEIMIIDNGSTDESLDYLKQYGEDLSVVALKDNHGFADGYNRGLAHCDTEYVALINSDVRTTPGWLTPIIDLLDGDSSIGMVQPKILSDQRHTHFEYAGACGGYLDAFGYPYCRGRLFDTAEEDLGQYDEATEVMWTSGAAMIMRTDLFTLAGGFDADFFAHQEEIDLCWRVRRAGYRHICLPQSVVYHLGGATLDYNNPKKVYLNIRNNHWMRNKNYPGAPTIRVGLLRMLLDIAASFFYLLQGKPSAMIATWKGLWSGLQGVPHKEAKDNHQKYFAKRYALKAKTTLESYPHPLPWMYYIKGKRLYSQLK